MYALKDVDKNTWAYEDVMPDGDTVRFFVLDGQEKCLVIDSGYMGIDIKALVKKLLISESRDKTQEGTEKEIILANTHGDMDHTGGNGSFDSFYITKTDYENCGLKDRFPSCRYIQAEEGTHIDLGGRQLRYIMVPGHTFGNAALLDETNRILFPGDMVQTGTMFMFGPHRCPEKQEESLLKLSGMKNEFDRIYACHGQMILDPDAVDETLTAWRKVLDKKVDPEPRNVLDTDVYMYRCGFCNFFCNI